MKQISVGIYATLRAAVLGTLPDIRSVNNIYVRACLKREYFQLRARSIEVTATGYHAYEAFKNGEVPMRKNIGPLAKSVLAFAKRDLRNKLIEFSRRAVA